MVRCRPGFGHTEVEPDLLMRSCASWANLLNQPSLSFLICHVGLKLVATVTTKRGMHVKCLVQRQHVEMVANHCALLWQPLIRVVLPQNEATAGCVLT